VADPQAAGPRPRLPTSQLSPFLEKIKYFLVFSKINQKLIKKINQNLLFSAFFTQKIELSNSSLASPSQNPS
jgi:hypothetical protein